jgi:hypothetical protein
MPPDVDLAGPVDSSWDGEDFDEPLLHVAVDRRTGDLVGLRLVPRGQDRSRPVIHVPARREREPKPRSRRARRAGSSRDGPRSEDDDPHELDAGGVLGRRR